MWLTTISAQLASSTRMVELADCIGGPFSNPFLIGLLGGKVVVVYCLRLACRTCVSYICMYTYCTYCYISMGMCSKLGKVKGHYPNQSTTVMFIGDLCTAGRHLSHGPGMSWGIWDAWSKGLVEIKTNTLRFVHVWLDSVENKATSYSRYKVVLKVPFEAGCLYKILVLQQYQLTFSCILPKSSYYVNMQVIARPISLLLAFDISPIMVPLHLDPGNVFDFPSL